MVIIPITLACVPSYSDANVRAMSPFPVILLANVSSGMMYSDNPNEIVDTLNMLVATIQYDGSVPYLIVSAPKEIKKIDVAMYGPDGVMKQQIINATILDSTRKLKVRFDHSDAVRGQEILRVEVDRLTHYYQLLVH